jgi:NAD(P)H-quinone oxidoreductase subunit H
MFIPYVSRWDYAAGLFNEAVTVNAPEKLADIEVPRRASYIRAIMLELNPHRQPPAVGGAFCDGRGGADVVFLHLARSRMILRPV